MATKDEHLKKAQHNEKFFGEFDIRNTPYKDWVITGIFYSAIHYIRAVFAMCGFSNVSKYGHMDNLFSTLHIFRKNRGIYYDYRQLKDDSREARYEMKMFSPEEIIDLRDNEFQRIKSFSLANV